MATITVVRFGSSAGVWAMATRPEYQRQGLGRGLLTRILEQYRESGVERFFLSSSDSGKPLYESIGFELVENFCAWVRAA